MNEAKQKYVLPFLLPGAVLTGLTLIFPKFGFLEWVTLIPVFIGAYRLCGSSKYGLFKSYLYGFLTIFSYYLVIYHWFAALYPMEFAGFEKGAALVVVLAGWVGLSLLQAIPGGLIFLIFKLLHRTPLFHRVPLLRPFVFSALWIIFEWSSTLHWSGVPWGRLCLGQSAYLPMLQSASLFGSYFISFLLLIVNGLFAYALLYRRRPRRSVICAAVAVCLILANLLGGCVRLWTQKEPTESLRVGVVQGNISSHDKWGEDGYYRTLEIYGEGTRRAAAEGAALVLWPETALPYTLNQSSSLTKFVTELAEECNVTLIIGALHTDEEGKDYNVLYHVTPEGELCEEVYAKRHLVPFGEYVPLRALVMTLIPPLAEVSMLEEDLTPGTGSALFETEKGSLGGLICFDSIYESLSLESVRDGADLLLLASNDSWFLDSAAIYQHERQAQLRAIETGRYLVRAGNTGISTLISNTGEHLTWINAMEEGTFVADAGLCQAPTLYTVIGNLPVYLCLAFCVGSAFLGIYWRKKQETPKIANSAS